MREVYPTRFSFDGLVELTYKNYDISVSSGNRTTSSSYSTFEQKYRIGLQGFVYNPRLLVFWSHITYSDELIPKSKDTQKTDSKNVQYDLSAVFLPYRPVTLTMFATRYDYSFRGITFSDTDIHLNEYGAFLTSFSKNLPAVRFEYYHQDVTSSTLKNSSQKSETTRYWLNIHGNLKFIKTQYTLNMGLIDTSSSF